MLTCPRTQISKELPGPAQPRSAPGAALQKGCERWSQTQLRADVRALLGSVPWRPGLPHTHSEGGLAFPLPAPSRAPACDASPAARQLPFASRAKKVYVFSFMLLLPGHGAESGETQQLTGQDSTFSHWKQKQRRSQGASGLLHCTPRLSTLKKHGPVCSLAVFTTTSPHLAFYDCPQPPGECKGSKVRTDRLGGVRKSASLSQYYDGQEITRRQYLCESTFGILLPEEYC